MEKAMFEKLPQTDGHLGSPKDAEGECSMNSVMKDPLLFPSLKDARKQFEKSYLTRLLEITHGNVAAAAKLAQRHRTEFYKLLIRHGVDHASFKATTE